jgi:dihydropteroate synthase
MTDRVEIRGLRIPTRVGTTEQERAAPQTVEVDIALSCDVGASARNDKLAWTIDYAAVRDAVHALAAARPRPLIETLAEDTAQHMLATYRPARVEVAVRKFVFADTASVGVRVVREASGALQPMHLRRANGSTLRLDGHTCALMGIVNLTPDSFSDGGAHASIEAARRHAHRLVDEGAHILDLGAESTRPGADDIGADEEWRRLGEVLALLAKDKIAAVLSVDTRRLATAMRARELGAAMLNLPFPQDLLAQDDIATLRAVLASFDAVVCMHSRGNPQTMRELCRYDGDVGEAVAQELGALVTALCGDAREKVIVDPGIGFAKDAAQSFALLGSIDKLAQRLGRPVLVGASRKSFLGAAGGLGVHERLLPSVAAAVLAAQQGAWIARVHDVAATRESLLVVSACQDAATSLSASAVSCPRP